MAAGGTFDLLHRGHRNFLKDILEKTDGLVLGLTSDLYVEENKPDQGIAAYSQREKALNDFFKEIGVLERVQIIPIDDVYGPTITTEFDFDSLAVTSESEKNGELINKKRHELGLPFLKIEVFPVTHISSGQEKLSSSFLRNRILKLPPALRILLQEPFGEVIENIPNGNTSKIVTVGDATTKRFLDAGIKPLLVIVDNKVERKDVERQDFENREIYQVKNPASTITPELVEAIKKALKQERLCVIEVEGEEDLAVLPVLEIAPIGFTVYYGQPHVGLVEVIISDTLKSKAKELLNEFEI